MKGSKLHADNINTILGFLARRDSPELECGMVREHCGIECFDLLVLLGGVTVPDVAELAAKTWKAGMAKKVMLVGGEGHSTDNLRKGIRSHSVYGSILTDQRTEADMLTDVLVGFLEVPKEALLIENRSTNCGNNASYALEVVMKAGCSTRSVLLLQDPTMQRRSHECFCHEWADTDTKFFSYAPFIPYLISLDGDLEFTDPLHSRMHSVENLVRLVMGEIPRLCDDANGYGPCGAGYIGHVEIPRPVNAAFCRLLEAYPEMVRERLS